MIGFIQKRYYENTNEKVGLTFIPSLLTLGTIPYWEEREVRFTFIVFDKQLNQIQKIETTSIHEFIGAWWTPFLDEFDLYNTVSSTAKFYKPNAKQFSKELVQVLKK